MDDIKESVRVAATKTAQSLSRVSIKMCDSGTGSKSGEAAVKAILPPLLEKGLTSTVTEVRAICLVTMMKVAKSAALLEATGEMESSQLGYISTRLGTDADVQEKLDSARMAASKSSRTMECVNYVLQYVDTEVLTQLVPRLVEEHYHDPSTGAGVDACVAEALALLRRREVPAAVPDRYCCQISMEVMLDPLTTPSGITYERASLREHLQKVGAFDPVTRAPLRLEQAVPNIALRETIREYLDEHPWAYESNL